MALCTAAFRSLSCAFTLGAGTRSRRSPSDKRLAAVLAGSPWPFDGDVLMRTFHTNQAVAFAGVGEPVCADDCPDVFVHVAGLV